MIRFVILKAYSFIDFLRIKNSSIEQSSTTRDTKEGAEGGMLPSCPPSGEAGGAKVPFEMQLKSYERAFIASMQERISGHCHKEAQ